MDSEAKTSEEQDRERLEEERWRLAYNFGDKKLPNRYTYQSGMAGHHGFISKCTTPLREGVRTGLFTCVIQNIEGHIMSTISGTRGPEETPQTLAEEQLQVYLRDHHPHA